VDGVRNHIAWKENVTYRQSVDGIATGGQRVWTMWEKGGADQVVVVDLSAHVGGGDVEPIVEQRGRKEEVGTEVTAVVERVASDHADDVGPVVEETASSMMAVMEGEEKALQQKELLKAMWFCFQDKKKHCTLDTFRRRCTIAGHMVRYVLQYVTWNGRCERIIHSTNIEELAVQAICTLYEHRRIGRGGASDIYTV